MPYAMLKITPFSCRYVTYSNTILFRKEENNNGASLTHGIHEVLPIRTRKNDQKTKHEAWLFVVKESISSLSFYEGGRPRQRQQVRGPRRRRRRT
ncbi:MAG: hypothetical protein SPI58_05700, partial [Candidatus Enteromonas sp.]|nr:hypothetical protein [Candidatus Enteromonas sp.]